ncbi:MAG: hypothetical protein AVO38_10925 [delta proteobacterium ML8_D]|nr:MAG: hypothetical protein AVO34_05320 [Firmicutes bacterium ML8_F2]OPL15100.1 MAG: hypothetical protein AVO38_10925 [delta proteobacterium ML8_D]
MANGLNQPKTTLTVRLTDCQDVFQIMRRVEKTLRYNGFDDLAREYLVEATSSDFDHLMISTLEYVNIENDQPARELSVAGRANQTGRSTKVNNHIINNSRKQ